VPFVKVDVMLVEAFDAVPLTPKLETTKLNDAVNVDPTSNVSGVKLPHVRIAHGPTDPRLLESDNVPNVLFVAVTVKLLELKSCHSATSGKS
jgi:hypothetical protein